MSHVCEMEVIVQSVERLPSLLAGNDDGARHFIPGPRYARCRLCHEPMDENQRPEPAK